MQRLYAGGSTLERCLALAVVLLGLAGCIQASAVDRDWGNSVRNNIAQQVLNPQAGLNTSPAVGLPPQAAVNEMESYNKSYEPAEREKKTLTTTATPGYTQ